MKLARYLEFTPMTREQVCICCHVVRYCKGCCRTCKNECNSKHECEFDSFPEGHDCTWWNSVTDSIRIESIRQSLPDNLLKAINNYTI